MPELPEVETIARSLRNDRDLPFLSAMTLEQRPGVVGRRVASADVFWERSIAEPSAIVFSETIAAQTILAVKRRGKFLWLPLDRDNLLIHLRMSGDVRMEKVKESQLLLHDRLALNFEDGTRLVLNDPRKFGRVWLVQDEDSVFKKLGPEPFSPNLATNIWYGMLKTHRRLIKPLLMDQGFIAGLGNIYTDEALHLSGIHPLQRSDRLSEIQAGTLIKTIREVLQAGIERNGASIDWVYRGGEFQNEFNVYQRRGKPCHTCGTPIERIVLGQRGTHFCPQCQLLEK